MAGAARLSSWFYWHSAVGATCGLLLTLVCWTGTFATLGHEIDWLFEPAIRVPHQAQHVSVTDLYDAAQKRFPDGLVQVLSAPVDTGFAAEALVDVGNDVTVRVYIDPHTAEVLGTTSLFNAWRFFRSFHINFFGLFSWGRYVVSFTGLALLVLVVTTLVFWKRWWTRFLEANAPRPPVGAWSPLHRLTGLWFLWFAALMAVTGTWYLVEITRLQFIDARTSMTAPPELPALTERPDKPTVAEIIARAQTARPDLRITQVRFGDEELPDYIEGWAGHTLVRAGANHVYIDPRDGAVLAQQAAPDLTIYWRVKEAMDPLHFGDFAGLPSKVVWFIAGLILSASGFTGALLMARSARQRGGRPRAAGRVLRWVGLAIGMGVMIVAAAEGRSEYLGFMRDPGGLAGTQNHVSPGVLAFIVGWITVTTSAMVWWVWELR